MLDEFDFLKVVKNVSLNAQKASNPVEVTYGEVTSTDPLEIKLLTCDITIDTDIIILTEYSRNMGLEVSDLVVLIKVQQGNKYIVLDRMVEK